MNNSVILGMPNIFPAQLGTKTITENGTYNASADGLDGYSQVTANIALAENKGYQRVVGVPNGEQIIENAIDIEVGGVVYKPIYYVALSDTINAITFTKTGTGLATGADAYLFSDDLLNLQVGTSVLHTFDTTQDFSTIENWKCRYAIMYATEANFNNTNGITVDIYNYRSIFEFVSRVMLFSYSATISSSTNYNLKYINIENAIIKNDTIAVANFIRYAYTLIELKLPKIVSVSVAGCLGGLNSLDKITDFEYLTIVSGSSFMENNYNIKKVNFPALTTISGNAFLSSCQGLKEVSLPLLQSITAQQFLYNCNNIDELDLPSLTIASGAECLRSSRGLQILRTPLLETISGSLSFETLLGLTYADLSSVTILTKNSTTNFLGYTQFIKLKTDFDIDGCNFTGATGYSKSYEWLNNELPTKLKDNSSGAAKTMTIGATNISLITAENQAIISGKNWTLA